MNASTWFRQVERGTGAVGSRLDEMTNRPPRPGHAQPYLVNGEQQSVTMPARWSYQFTMMTMRGHEGLELVARLTPGE